MGVFTLTVLAVRWAVAGIVTFAVTVVEVGVPVIVAVMAPPVPVLNVTSVAPVRSVPVMVTEKEAPPRACAVGLMAVTVGPLTVNVTALLTGV